MALQLLGGDTTQKLDRWSHITFFNSNVTSVDENGIVYGDTPTWLPFGEDNDELTRELNDELDASKNVLGSTNIDHTSGANTTEIDPIAIRSNDVLSAILYNMFKYELKGDKAVLQCMEVTYGDIQDDGSYGAFTESAIVQQNSWGGDTTKLNSPIVLNWKGDRVHGTYDVSANTFTETTTA